MARTGNKLSARFVQTVTEPGFHADGHGLYLQVSPQGSKSWAFRYALDGKARWMGLGPAFDVSLADARAEAQKCRAMLREKIDPIDERRARFQEKKLEAAMTITFDDAAAQYIAAHRAKWKNDKHTQQWENTLSTYASPVFGKLPVAAIDTALITRALEKDGLWLEKHETAARLRGRIERVLSWSTVRGYRKGENPARWKGHLEELLPRISEADRVQHHPALPYAVIGHFVAQVRGQAGIAALALEFTILTCARTAEAIGAKWDEIDRDNAIWTIPGSRMKMKKEHRIPLSPRALEILEGLERVKSGDFIFPGGRTGKPIS
ncbi:MAG: integrase, partial [Burkholderiales bacterium 21-58-4]